MSSLYAYHFDEHIHDPYAHEEREEHTHEEHEHESGDVLYQYAKKYDAHTHTHKRSNETKRGGEQHDTSDASLSCRRVERRRRRRRKVCRRRKDTLKVHTRLRLCMFCGNAVRSLERCC